MRELFFIRLGNDVQRVSWLDANEQVVEGALHEAAAQIGARRVAVFVPAADITFRQVTVPTRNRARLAAAVPYLLEDLLADDVEDLHFAIGERGADERVAVAIIARARLDGWLAVLHEAGIQPAALVPEVLALPYQAGAWTLFCEPGQILTRTAAQSGFVLDADNLVFVLERALAEAEPRPESVWLYGAGGAADAAAAVVTTAGVIAQLQAEAGPPLALFAGQYHEPTSLNLLQGTYSRREQLGKLWRPWRPALALLALWVIAQFGVKIYQHGTFSAENERLRAEVNQIYLSSFPDAKRVVDARVQMEQRLAALRGSGQSGGGFMELMAALSDPQAIASGVELRKVAYKDGELNVALTIGDLQRLEQYKNQLMSGGFTVEIQSATARNDRVEAQLHIKRTAS
ncbi:MAG: type II secretion system protein GspL [Pseudomonadota bacterium]